MNLTSLINENIQSFNNSKNNDERLAKINLLIELLRLEDQYQTLLYKNIKVWMKCYILSTQRKKFSYDEIIFEKVQTKTSYLKSIEEQLNLLHYFERLLKQYNFNEKIYEFEQYQKKLELLLSLEKKDYLSTFLKISTYNLFSLLLILLVSLLLFSGIYYFLQQTFHIFDIVLITYTQNELSNLTINLIAYLFNINKTLELQSPYGLFFLIILKIYFYIMITYFVLKEFSKRLEKQ